MLDTNHPIHPGPETQPRLNSKYLKLLDTLIDTIIKRLEDNSCQPKVRDALMAIQLREKVAKSSEAENTFWELIDSIRTSELSEPNSMQCQIQDTILDLRHLVKNGILPVKTIADTFNETRSEQGRLTYHRMGRLLSAMGFTKARTPNGAAAIIWDDNLLLGPPGNGSSSFVPLTRGIQGVKNSDSLSSMPPDPSTGDDYIKQEK